MSDLEHCRRLVHASRRNGRAIAVGVVLCASASAFGQLTDPCEQRGQTQSFDAAYVDIGDLDGEGNPEYAFIDPDESGAAVEVYSSSTGLQLMELHGGKADFYFYSFMDGGNIDGDGYPETAVASVYLSGQALEIRFNIYSGVTGKLMAYLYPEPDGEGGWTLKPVLASDVEKSGNVTNTDLVMVSDAIATQSYQPALDVNKDDAVDGFDAIEVADDLGDSSANYDFKQLTDRILAADGAVDNEQFTTVFADNRGAGAPVQAGIVGCFLCGLRCGDALDQAWDCKEKLWEAKCDCWDIPDLFERSACLDDVRLNFLPDCLQDVIDATETCAKCIKKCGPKPSATASS